MTDSSAYVWNVLLKFNISVLREPTNMCSSQSLSYVCDTNYCPTYFYNFRVLLVFFPNFFIHRHDAPFLLNSSLSC